MGREALNEIFAEFCNGAVNSSCSDLDLGWVATETLAFYFQKSSPIAALVSIDRSYYRINNQVKLPIRIVSEESNTAELLCFVGIAPVAELVYIIQPSLKEGWDCTSHGVLTRYLENLALSLQSHALMISYKYALDVSFMVATSWIRHLVESDEF